MLPFWARIGRAVESVLRMDSILRLKRRGEATPLSDCLRTIDTRAGRARVTAVLSKRPFPHFEPAADRPGFLVKIDAGGKRTIGRFVKREFRAVGRK
jgi:hypothetical protein